MTELERNKEILTTMLEKDAGNIYEKLRESALKVIPVQFKPIANNYLKANEKKWLKKMEEYCSMLAETSFPSPETTLEEALANAEESLNAFIGGFLQSKLGIDQGSINIVLNMLLGVGI